MCGIAVAFSYSKKYNAAKKVFEQYQAQKHRGSEGFGFVAMDTTGIVYARSRFEKEIKDELDKLKNPSLVMFHHRRPTSSPNSIEANHPIFIKNKKNLENRYFLIHNGHISNCEDLRQDHEQMGVRYSSEVSYSFANNDQEYTQWTDSEALGYELALYVEGKIPAIRTQGGIACFLLQINNDNVAEKIYYFRNKNPLVSTTESDGMLISSEGSGVHLASDTLFCTDWTDKIATTSQAISVCTKLDFSDIESEDLEKIDISDMWDRLEDDNDSPRDFALDYPRFNQIGKKPPRTDLCVDTVTNGYVWLHEDGSYRTQGGIVVFKPKELTDRRLLPGAATQIALYEDAIDALSVECSKKMHKREALMDELEQYRLEGETTFVEISEAELENLEEELYDIIDQLRETSLAMAEEFKKIKQPVSSLNLPSGRSTQKTNNQ